MKSKLLLVLFAILLGVQNSNAQRKNANLEVEVQKAIDILTNALENSTTEPEKPIKPIDKVVFKNKGVFSKESEGLLFEWIPTESVDLEVIGKKVKLIAPETKRSFDGSNSCNRFVLSDLYDKPLNEKETEALFKDGLELPVGQYSLKILYLNSRKFPSSLWDYTGMSGNQYKNSATPELITFSITDDTQDAQYTRTSWFPQYFVLPARLKLPDDKILGVTRFLEDVSKDSIYAKTTHIQWIYNWLGDSATTRGWKNIQGYNHDGNYAPPSEIPNLYPASSKMVIMAEIAENYGNRGVPCPQCYTDSELALKGIYEKQQRELGVKSPKDSWIIGDYFSPIYGGSVFFDFGSNDLKKKHLQQGLSNVEGARTRLHGGNLYTSAYFSDGWHEYRNYLYRGYLGNTTQQATKLGFYEDIYNHEKTNLAIPDRKNITYLTNTTEGLGVDYLATIGVYYRLKMDNGELLRLEGINHGFNTLYTNAFWSYVFGNGVILWESSNSTSTKIEDFGLGSYGGVIDWKTIWRDNKGNQSTYVSGQNGAPVMTNAIARFPEKPLNGDQAIWLASYEYSKIVGKVDELYYPSFEYNGKTIREPKGKKGNRISYNGFQNEGLLHIIDLMEQEFPLIIKGKGLKGDVILYQNPNAGLATKQTVEVEGKEYTIIGNKVTIIHL